MYINGQDQMIKEQIISRGIQDSWVIKAVSEVPRELFVPNELKSLAYEDSPLPIGYKQTISQPFIVAFMTESAGLDQNSRVLEIGTGCGYQAAILSKLCKEVYSIEVLKPLGEEAAIRLKKLGYKNIHLRIGDGYKGWPENSPFDAIIVTAAPEDVPQALIDQLKEGGRLIIPVGTFVQELIRITRIKDKIKKENLMPVRFVPMVKEPIVE
ncbi:S-adenosylmethionine-dependent methyltransferase (plasmid) [Candidatus Trichorickettsia mobilis]|uniref:protein-L-isoaspartate(D-aspartate) O-methyltransferase n=1 Tax=Candidatus Trichorickettsia mobilis TaxID=1346319 RepID=UPI002B25942B|nr:protein-L-isoaspartate(D-aspartate) O-methyltransferase [Candidatus Trichorickettsia mobilis]WPY01863.1 S-adenosylmethionine-dependent methyltransferase [Candidatus Trichorickettsia mobilis]